MILFESYELDDDVQIVSNESLEPELQNCTSDNTVIPETCLTFTEGALYVTEHAHVVFNEMFESIGIDELAVFESTGSVAIYEGARLNALKEKAVNLFKKMWQTIKDAYEKVIKWFEDKLREMRKKKVAKFTADNIAKISKDRELGKTYEFTGLSNDDNFAKNAKVAFNGVLTGERWKVLKDSSDAKDKVEEYRKKLYSAISGVSDVTNLNDMKEKLKKKLYGNEVTITKEFMTKNMKSISDEVIAGNGKRTIKKAYNEERSHINSIIKSLKKLNDNTDTAFINSQIALLRDTTTTLHACFMVKMDANKRRFVDYMRMVTIVGSYNNKVLAKESYDYTDTSNIVESVFNW